MNIRIVLTAILWFASLAHGQTLKLPTEVKGDPGAWVVIVPESKDGGDVKWRMSPGLTQVRLDQLFPGQKSAGVVVQGPRGQYEVWAWCAKGDVASDLAVCKVVIGDGVPVPPVPPGPVPPTPPVPPGPTPTPAPIPVAGMRVLIVYETADLGKLPTAQIQVLYADAVRQELNRICVAGPDGKTREWRIWDKDVITSFESKLWQDAMKRPRPAMPWVIISDGQTGYEGPLPNTVEETKSLLKKWGGS